MWFARVEDFADRAQAVVAEMNGENLEKFARPLLVIRMNFKPGIDKRPNEPRPHRALMIGAIARAQIAGINRFVIRIIR